MTVYLFNAFVFGLLIGLLIAYHNIGLGVYSTPYMYIRLAKKFQLLHSLEQYLRYANQAQSYIKCRWNDYQYNQAYKMYGALE